MAYIIFIKLINGLVIIELSINTYQILMFTCFLNFMVIAVCRSHLKNIWWYDYDDDDDDDNDDAELYQRYRRVDFYSR